MRLRSTEIRLYGRSRRSKNWWSKIVIGKSSSDKISNMLKILSCNDIKFSYSMQFAPGTLSRDFTL